MLGIGDQKMLATAETLSHEAGKLIYLLLESLKSGSGRHAPLR
jgi:hypothetical protein